MAVVTKKEFSQQCGFATNQLSVFISRNKIIVDSNGNIDNENLKNAAFLSKRKARIVFKSDMPSASDINRQQEILKSQSEPDSIQDSGKKKPRKKTSDSEYFELETQQKELAIQKSKEEIELLRIRREKLNGELIPVELVKIIFSQHTKSVLVENHNFLEKILTVFAKSANLSKIESSKIREEILIELNKSAKKSLDESKKSIKEMISEFSEKRTKGQRE